MYIHNGKQADSVSYLVQKKKVNFFKYKIKEIKQCIANLLSTKIVLISCSFYEFHLHIYFTG